jgi:hypothetical protein
MSFADSIECPFEEPIWIRTEDDMMAFHAIYCADSAYVCRSVELNLITTPQFVEYLQRSRVLVDTPLREFNPKEPIPVQVTRVALPLPSVRA